MTADARLVTLSGYRAGSYAVVEERPDGSLVIVPAATSQAARAPESKAPRVSDLFSGLLRRPSPETRTTIPELLEARGVVLAAGEEVREFIVAQIDARDGYAAVTSGRLLFLPHGVTDAEEHALASVRTVEPTRRVRRQQLRITLTTGELLITADRDALARLQRTLG